MNITQQKRRKERAHVYWMFFFFFVCMNNKHIGTHRLLAAGSWHMRSRAIDGKWHHDKHESRELVLLLKTFQKASPQSHQHVNLLHIMKPSLCAKEIEWRNYVSYLSLWLFMYANSLTFLAVRRFSVSLQKKKSFFLDTFSMKNKKTKNQRVFLEFSLVLCIFLIIF